MSLEAAIQNLADAIKEYTEVVKGTVTETAAVGPVSVTTTTRHTALPSTLAEVAHVDAPSGKKSKTEETPPAAEVKTETASTEKTEAEIRAEALDAPDGYCFKAQMELSKGGNREGVKAVLDIFGAKTLKDVKTKAIPEFHKALLVALEKKNAAPEEEAVEGVVETADEIRAEAFDAPDGYCFKAQMKFTDLKNEGAFISVLGKFGAKTFEDVQTPDIKAFYEALLIELPLEKDDPEFAKLFDVATGAISVPYLKIKKDPDHKDWADEIMAKFGVARPSLVPRGRLKELQIEISNYTARASAGA